MSDKWIEIIEDLFEKEKEVGGHNSKKIIMRKRSLNVRERQKKEYEEWEEQKENWRQKQKQYEDMF